MPTSFSLEDIMAGGLSTLDDPEEEQASFSLDEIMAGGLGADEAPMAQEPIGEIPQDDFIQESEDLYAKMYEMELEREQIRDDVGSGKFYTGGGQEVDALQYDPKKHWTESEMSEMLEGRGNLLTRTLRTAKDSTSDMLQAGMERMNLLPGILTDPRDADTVIGEMQERQAEESRFQRLADKDSMVPFATDLREGGASVLQSATGGALGGFARGAGALLKLKQAAPLIAQYTTDVANNSYTKGINSGMTVGKALGHAILMGSIEGGVTAIFSAFGRGGAENMFASKWRGFMGFAKGVVSEVAEENIIEGASMIAEAAQGVTEWPSFEEALQRHREVTGATVAAMGIMGGVQKFTDFVDKRTRSSGRKTGLPPDLISSSELRDKLAEEAKGIAAKLEAQAAKEKAEYEKQQADLAEEYTYTQDADAETREMQTVLDEAMPESGGVVLRRSDGEMSIQFEDGKRASLKRAIGPLKEAGILHVLESHQLEDTDHNRNLVINARGQYWAKLPGRKGPTESLGLIRLRASLRGDEASEVLRHELLHMIVQNGIATQAELDAIAADIDPSARTRDQKDEALATKGGKLGAVGKRVEAFLDMMMQFLGVDNSAVRALEDELYSGRRLAGKTTPQDSRAGKTGKTSGRTGQNPEDVVKPPLPKVKPKPPLPKVKPKVEPTKPVVEPTTPELNLDDLVDVESGSPEIDLGSVKKGESYQVNRKGKVEFRGEKFVAKGPETRRAAIRGRDAVILRDTEQEGGANRPMAIPESELVDSSGYLITLPTVAEVERVLEQELNSGKTISPLDNERIKKVQGWLKRQGREAKRATVKAAKTTPKVEPTKPKAVKPKPVKPKVKPPALPAKGEAYTNWKDFDKWHNAGQKEVDAAVDAVEKNYDSLTAAYNDPSVKPLQDRLSNNLAAVTKKVSTHIREKLQGRWDLWEPKLAKNYRPLGKSRYGLDEFLDHHFSLPIPTALTSNRLFTNESSSLANRSETVEKLAKNILRKWAGANNLDADGILGTMSGMSNKGKKELVSSSKEFAEHIYDTVAEELANPTVDLSDMRAEVQSEKELQDRASRKFGGDVVQAGTTKPALPAPKAEITEVASKPLPPVGELKDNYTKPLSEYADTLFHETSVDFAPALIPQGVLSTQLEDLHVSNTANMALGQGGKGVLLEFSAGDIEGQVNKSKPAWSVVWENGEAEFVAHHADQAVWKKNLKSITVKDDAESSSVKRRVLLKALKTWPSEKVEGGTKYTRPVDAVTKPKAKPPASPSKASKLSVRRERARSESGEKRYWKDSRKRAAKVKGKKEQIEVIKGSGKKQTKEKVTGERIKDDWAITKSEDESGKAVYNLTHTPTGLSAVSGGNATDIRQFVQMAEDLGYDLSKIEKDGTFPETLRKQAQKLRKSWDTESMEGLTQEERSKLVGMKGVAETGVKADLVLEGADLGVYGDRGLKESGLKAIKEISKAVPEFSYDPVFTVDKDKKLVYQDGVTYKLEPEQFNLEAEELTAGQTVGFNLEDIGIKPNTAEDVVAKTLKSLGFASVSKPTKNRATITAKRNGKVTTVSGSGQEWVATSPDAGSAAEANSALEHAGFAKGKPKPSEDFDFTDEQVNEFRAKEAATPEPPNTPKWKRWFGKSKVVDKEGNPRRAFHGTRHADLGLAATKEHNKKAKERIKLQDAYEPIRQELMAIGTKRLDALRENNYEESQKSAELEKEYDALDKKHTRPRNRDSYRDEIKPEIQRFHTDRFGENDTGYLSAGTYFTFDPEFGGEYSQGTGAVFPVYLSLQNPFIHGEHDNTPVEKLTNEKLGVARDTVRTSGGDVDDFSRAVSVSRRQALEELGYDGEIYEREVAGGRKSMGVSEIVVFNDTQIKSATANDGEYSPDNPDIQASPSPSVLPGAAPQGRFGTLESEQAALNITTHADRQGDTGPTVQAEEIIEGIEKIGKAFGADAPIRGGLLGRARKALGYYQRSQAEIRLEARFDSATAAHEIGHAVLIALRLDGINNLRARVGTPAIKELIQIGKNLYGTRVPVGGYYNEGVAEFFRFYVSRNRAMAQTQAPKFFAEFEKILQDHPEGRAAMDDAQDLVQRWGDQGAVARLDSQQRDTSSLRSRFRKALRNWRDRKVVVRHIEEAEPLHEYVRAYEEGSGKDIQWTKQDIYRKFKEKRGIEKGHMQRMLHHEMVDIHGNPVGQSLDEALSVLKKGDFENWQRYMAASRAMHLLAATSGPRDPGVSADDSLYVFNEYDSAEFRLARENFYAWREGMLDYISAASPEIARNVETIRKSNIKEFGAAHGYYVPLMRIHTETRGAGKADPGKSADGTVSHRLKGSPLPFKEVLPAAVAQAQSLMKAAHRRAIVDTMFELHDESRGDVHNQRMAPYLVEIPEATIRTDIPLDKIATSLRAALSKLGISEQDLFGPDGLDNFIALSLTVDDAFAEFYSKGGKAKGGAREQPIITRVDDGKMRFYRADRNLYEALMGAPPSLLQTIARSKAALPLVIPNRIARMGMVGVRAGFAGVTSPLREFGTRALHSRETNPLTFLHDYRRGIYDTALYATSAGLVETDWMKTYHRLGVESANFLAVDSKVTKQEVKSSMSTRTERVLDPRNWFRYVHGAMQSLDAAPRIAEMRMIARQIGWNPSMPLTEGVAMQLGLRGKEITADFGAGSPDSRALNDLIFFWNISLQGPRAVPRHAREHPMRFAAGVTAWTGLLLANWWRNKDEEHWKERNRAQDFMYIRVKVGDEILLIPINQEAAQIGQSMIAMLDAAYQQDPGSAIEYFGAMARMYAPSFPVLLQYFKERWQNKKDYNQSPIVPKHIDRDRTENRDQFGAYTSETMKVLGDGLNWSPSRMEHAVRTFGGGVGGDILGTIDKGVKLSRGDSEDVLERADTFLVGRLWQRGGIYGTRPRSVDKLFDAVEHAAKIYNSRKRKAETPYQKELRLQLDDARGAAMALLNMRSLLKTVEEKRDFTKKAVEISRRATKEYWDRNVTKETRDHWRARRVFWKGYLSDAQDFALED